MLADLLLAAAAGRPPAVDGGVTVVPPWREGLEAVVALTGHAVVATTLPLSALLEAGADGFGGATLPAVTTLLAGTGAIDTLDVLLHARGTGGGSLPRVTMDDHPRIAHARAWRTGVRVHGDGRGVVLLAEGVGGLTELSFEVPAQQRGRGYGRALLREGLALAAPGEVALIASAPGNVASLRAILAAGAVPLGSVQLVRPRRG